ncbi:MAG: hypothetical protein AAF441_23920, partial [Pseudomonadota bacterium]
IITLSAALLDATKTYTLEFRQEKNIAYQWGVTDLIIEEVTDPGDPPADTVVTLTVDDVSGPDTTEYGNNYGADTEAGDGIARFDFDAGAGTQDIILTATGFDIDSSFNSGMEVQVFLNDTALQIGGSDVFLDTTANGAEGPEGGNYFVLDDALLSAGTNTLSFRQLGNVDTFQWGVTDVMLTTPVDLLLSDLPTTDNTDTTEYGSHDGSSGVFGSVSNAHGYQSFEFVSTGNDMTLDVDGFDVDATGEIDIILNGDDSFGTLGAGTDNDLRADYTIPLLAASLNAVGETNIITFRQDPTFTDDWGVTNLVLEDVV